MCLNALGARENQEEIRGMRDQPGRMLGIEPISSHPCMGAMEARQLMLHDVGARSQQTHLTVPWTCRTMHTPIGLHRDSRARQHHQQHLNMIDMPLTGL